MNYWRGGYFDFGGFDPKRMTELSRLADPSQAVDPLYNPALMVDLSQGYNLSQGFDPSRVPSGGPPRVFLPSPGIVGFAPNPWPLIPGPGVVGLYGLFEGDFRPAEEVPAPPQPPRGLLILGSKKKVWKPRKLVVRRVVGVAPMVDCAWRGEQFAHGRPWWLA